jgi:hypothetical protein
MNSLIFTTIHLSVNNNARFLPFFDRKTPENRAKSLKFRPLADASILVGSTITLLRDRKQDHGGENR